MMVLKLNTKESLNLRDGWSRAALIERARAGGISLLASAVVISLVTAAIAVFMHTLPAFWASGGYVLMMMVGSIDLVLGPVLSFLVYDRRKRSLKRDMIIIVCIQLAAMGYGVWTSILARPVFMTFAVDRFELLSAADVDSEELARAPARFSQLSWRGPVIAAARPPDDPVARENLLFASTASGIDLKHLLRYYVGYEQMAVEASRRARALDELTRYNRSDDIGRELGSYIRTHGESALVYLPVQGKREDLLALLRRDNGAVLAVVRLRPW